MVTGLGYALPQALLSGLSQNDHSAIMEATKPAGIPPSVIGKAYRDDPDLAEAMFKNAPAKTQHVALQTAKTLMPTFSKWAERYKADDLPPEAPSFITRVCGFGFHILLRQFEQALRVRRPHISQALGALQRVFGCPEMSAI